MTDSQHVALVSKGEEMRVSFEYVYQAVSPEVVTDRSIHRLVAATVEGVNGKSLLPINTNQVTFNAFGVTRRFYF